MYVSAKMSFKYTLNVDPMFQSMASSTTETGYVVKISKKHNWVVFPSIFEECSWTMKVQSLKNHGQTVNRKTNREGMKSNYWMILPAIDISSSVEKMLLSRFLLHLAFFIFSRGSSTICISRTTQEINNHKCTPNDVR